jgi:hypothetical protein
MEPLPRMAWWWCSNGLLDPFHVGGVLRNVTGPGRAGAAAAAAGDPALVPVAVAASSKQAGKSCKKQQTAAKSSKLQKAACSRQ